MSFDALAWAAKAKGLRPAEKLVLLGLAECADRASAEAFPSLASLIEFSGLNRKTVIAALDALCARGLISDTGECVGRTKQIKVYRLHLETVPETERSQKRNSSTFSAEQSQKRNPEPVREQPPTKATPSTEKRAPAKRDEFPCPEGVDPVDWQGLIANRKAKRAGLSEAAHRQITNKLQTWASAGWPPGPIVAHAAERGWTSVFETDEMKGNRNGDRTGNPRFGRDDNAEGRTISAGRNALARLARSRGPGRGAGDPLPPGDPERIAERPGGGPAAIGYTGY